MVGSSDEVVGANVRVLREAAGFSQAALAQAMSDDGVPGWHPQTVTRIEAGVRSLKLVEALSLAKLLAVQPDYLYEAPATAGDDYRVRHAITELSRASREVERAADGLYVASEHLRDLLASLTVSADVRRHADAALDMIDHDLVERKRAEGEHEAAVEAAGEQYLQLQADIERGRIK